MIIRDTRDLSCEWAYKRFACVVWEGSSGKILKIGGFTNHKKKTSKKMSLNRTAGATRNLTSKKSRRKTPMIPLTKQLLVSLDDLRFSALTHLTNLRSLEFTGRTIQVGTTIPSVESQPFNDTRLPHGVDFEGTATSHLDPEWRTAHRNTLENLIRVIMRYYRVLYPGIALSTLWINLDIDHIEYIQHLGKEQDKRSLDVENDLDCAPAALDVKALEQLAADQCVEGFYGDPEISQDVGGWGWHARNMTNRYWTPMFESNEDEFYLSLIHI